MVKNGLTGTLATPEEIATLTCQTLLRTVPASMPGIFFLSGDTPLNVDNEESATINLSKMNELFAGKNKAAAQKALKNRAAANTQAVMGKYKPGTCASVGTDGNIK